MLVQSIPKDLSQHSLSSIMAQTWKNVCYISHMYVVTLGAAYMAMVDQVMIQSQGICMCSMHSISLGTIVYGWFIDTGLL